MSRYFSLVSGDRLPYLQRTITDDAGLPIDLTGAAVRWRMERYDGGALVIDQPATVLAPATAAVVRYDWTPDDGLLPAARYRGRFRGVTSTGLPFSEPRRGYIDVLISEDVGAAGAALAPVASVTVAPATLLMVQGRTQQLVVTARDASNNVLTGRTPIYVGVATVADVAPTGLVTALGTGGGNVTVTVGGVTVNVPTTVENRLDPDFEWIPADDGLLPRKRPIGLVEAHVRAAAPLVGAPGSGGHFRSPILYPTGDGRWQAFGFTSEVQTFEPVADAGHDKLRGGVTLDGASYAGSPFYPGSVAQRGIIPVGNTTADDNRPTFYRLQTSEWTAGPGDGGGALGTVDRYFVAWAVRADTTANVGKKVIVRIGYRDDVVGPFRDLRWDPVDPNYTGEVTVTLTKDWQSGFLECAIPHAILIANPSANYGVVLTVPLLAVDQPSAVVFDALTLTPRSGTSLCKRDNYQHYRPRGNIDTTYAGVTSQMVPRQLPTVPNRSLRARSQPVAGVTSLWSDDLNNAIWIKSAGTTVVASAVDTPDAHLKAATDPARKLWDLTIPAGGYIEQTCTHYQSANQTALPSAFSVAYTGLILRMFATADFPAGLTYRVMTLGAGGRVYGPKAVPTARDENGFCAVRLRGAGDNTDTSTTFTARITNTSGAPVTIRCTRVCIETDRMSGQGDENLIPSIIPCRTTSTFRLQSTTFTRINPASAVLSTNKGARVLKFMPTFNTSVAAGADLRDAFGGFNLFDSGPIGSFEREFLHVELNVSHFADTQFLNIGITGSDPNHNASWAANWAGGVISRNSVAGGEVLPMTMTEFFTDRQFTVLAQRWSVPGYYEIYINGHWWIWTGAGFTQDDDGSHAQTLLAVPDFQHWDFTDPVHPGPVLSGSSKDSAYAYNDRDQRLAFPGDWICATLWKDKYPSRAQLEAYIAELPD